MKYPTIALENGIQGQITVKFVIDKTGSVKNVRLYRGVDPSLDKEGLRIVESMPKWTPGKQNGETVDVAYEMPINFKLPAGAVRKQQLVTMSTPAKTSRTQPAINHTDGAHQLIIVPNPTKDKATITLKGSDSKKKLDVTIYDRDGKIIKKDSKSGPTFTLSFASYTSGTYLIVANDGTNQFSGQLVVNH
jgi:TonB family protein